MTEKMTKEFAEQEFDRFIETMDIDADPATMDEDDRKGFDVQKRRVITAIQKGALVINDNGEPVYTPQQTNDASAITFREPTGANLMAMDRKKKNEDMGKLYAIMGEMAGVHANTFAKMPMRDLRVCQAVVTLFLG